MQFPQFNPIALEIGGLKIHWYAITYIFGFAAAWLLGNYRADRSKGLWTREQVSDFLFYSYLGVILGGRIGYVIFYHFDFFLADPLYLFKIWQGGMSFHGGFLGVLFATWYFSKKTSKNFFTVADFIVPLVPLGLGAGRIGNFINGELWGRPVNGELPWGMVFPGDSLHLLRHPSQIYEFLLEGITLFIVVWLFSAKSRPAKAVSGVFVLGYGSFRFLVEFFREPDPQLGHVISWLTMGQILSAPMIIAGSLLLYFAYKKQEPKL